VKNGRLALYIHLVLEREDEPRPTNRVKADTNVWMHRQGLERAHAS
jgi:hypothetical protein